MLKLQRRVNLPLDLRDPRGAVSKILLRIGELSEKDDMDSSIRLRVLREEAQPIIKSLCPHFKPDAGSELCRSGVDGEPIYQGRYCGMCLVGQVSRSGNSVGGDLTPEERQQYGLEPQVCSGQTLNKAE